MDEYLSPNYKHEKLENPSHEDLVDVFEDTWKHFVFSPVEMLLHHPYGDIAAMTVLSSYFEAVWSYLSGEDSDRKSAVSLSKDFARYSHQTTLESKK